MHEKMVMGRFARLWLLFALIGAALLACNTGGGNQAKPGKEQYDGQTSEIDRLNDQIDSDSLNPENYYDRSAYYLQYKDLNKALSDINKAIQLQDNNARYYVLLSDIYLASGRIPNCLESLKKAESLEPGNNDALLKLAEVYLILQDYSNTFAYTKKALDKDRMNPMAYFIRGYAYMEGGDTALAIKNYQVAIDQDQNYYEAYIELGSLYFTLKDPLAGSYFKSATTVEPNRPEGYYLLGLTYQEQENFTGALETYEKLIAISPEFKEALYNMAYIQLVYLNEFEKAVDLFTRAIAIDPVYTDAYFNRGYSYELMGDYQNARRDYLKALEMVPNYERSISGLNRLDSLGN